MGETIAQFQHKADGSTLTNLGTILFDVQRRVERLTYSSTDVVAKGGAVIADGADASIDERQLSNQEFLNVIGEFVDTLVGTHGLRLLTVGSQPLYQRLQLLVGIAQLVDALVQRQESPDLYPVWPKRPK